MADKRSKERLSEGLQGPFDLVVVGGGIHGSLALLEASRAGMKVLLVEEGDFGGAASWGWLRILHGGMRYLQRGDLKRVRDSVVSRRWFFRNFPDLTSVMPSLMPLYNRGVKRRSTLAAALAGYEVLARDRDAGVSGAVTTPRGRVISRERTLELFPAAVTDSLRGGALWYEGFVDNPPRLLMEILNWARACGGRAENYLRATVIRQGMGSVTGLTVQDVLSGSEWEVESSRVLLCGGASGCGVEVAASALRPPEVKALFSFNLVIDRPLPSKHAVAVAPNHGRGHMYFLVPFGSKTLAGTFHEEWDSAADPKPQATPAQVVGVLSDLQDAMPGWPLVEDDVVGVLSGIVLDTRRSDRIEKFFDFGGPRGLFRVRSAKYTTAPVTARRILAEMGHAFSPAAPSPPSRPEAAQAMTCREFLDLHAADPEKAGIWAREIIESEAVRFPEDFVLRRMDWGLDPSEAEEASKVLRGILSGP